MDPPGLDVEDSTPDQETSFYSTQPKEKWKIDVFQLLGAMAAVGAGTAQPLMTLILGGLANEFNHPSDKARLKKKIGSEVLFFVYIFVGQWSLTCLYGVLLSISAMRHSRKLRAAYLRSAICQDMGMISQGKAIDNMATNISIIEDALSEKLGIVMQAGSTVVVAVIIAFVHSWQLSLALLSTIVLLFISNFGTAAIETRAERKIQEGDEEAASLAEECLGGIRLVMSCVAESKLSAKYAALLEKMRTRRLRKSPILGLQFSISYFALLCSYGLAFWYGTKLLNEGRIGSGGAIVIVIMSINQGTNGMRKILPFYGLLSKARAASNTLSKIINSKPAIDPLDPNGLSLAELKGSITLQNVEFAYSSRSSSKVLDNLSLSFEAGKTAALIGASGSGKSTIVGLLERWYDPSNGTVLIDGYDIKDLNVKSLRSNIGVVQQDVVLFNDTIFYNVACGLYGTSLEGLSENEKLELVIRSCIEVEAHAFIQGLPDGYNTRVGDKGNRLSGGQKQRIGIARAIISSPRILIFDEATSALDAESERTVEVAIKKASTNRTTIIIAHKLSFVQQADKIVLLKNGNILEEGTHQSLIALKGTYSRLLEAQELDGLTLREERTPLQPEVLSENTISARNLGAARSEMWLDTGNLETKMVPPVQMSLFQCLYSLFKENHTLGWLFIALVPISVIAGAIYPTQAILFGNTVSGFGIMDDIQAHENFWSLMWLLVAVGTFVAFLAMGIISSTMSSIAKCHYQTAYFDAMLRQPPQFFDQGNFTSGALVASLSLRTSQIQSLLNVLGFSLVAFVSITSCSILALATQWRLALVGLSGGMPIIMFAGYLRLRSGARRSKSLSEPLLDSAQYASEVIGAVRTVAALTMEEVVCHELDRKMIKAIPQFYRHIFTTMPLFAFSESGYFLGLALIFWYGGNLLTDGKVTSTQLWTIYLAVLAGGQGAGEIFANSNSIFQAKLAINTITELMRSAEERDQESSQSKKREEKEEGPLNSIEFRDVYFSYPNAPHHQVLENLNISVSSGQSLAIVGTSGSGKSTIISLLEKFYKANSGSIKIGPYELDTLDTASYRNTVSLVSQDTVLFQGTIRENILLGASEAETDDERLELAAKDANIHDFIASLPEGYSTQCGNKGMLFSGGQRQRIAIARALVRRPTILLLDEATSALDSLSEREVLEALKKIKRETTTITVAHRLATIKEADLILVLVRGRIVERGTHAKLLEKKGAYWAMCRAQALDREL
ncbi:Uncharacterized protein BP5553_07334 [Venustampulla echinocandica]|uniref:P-loop containing nucleoside triphosphate hydrolase n=1 Tax=Venustampulla echinocandica TaxID=2656787 RepID=A0A370TJ68_9HELO|nr:Uncharacterized protein BP5553_07334 [Venustampulla echinocandica]RDL35403.1 Uncharacterized protein BP5553_07334 [Venustampulla echinocandica]